jgi:hypothetical protein
MEESGGGAENCGGSAKSYQIFLFVQRQREERGARPCKVTDSMIFGGTDIFAG